jgi:hypothetical protein
MIIINNKYSANRRQPSNGSENVVDQTPPYDQWMEYLKTTSNDHWSEESLGNHMIKRNQTKEEDVYDSEASSHIKAAVLLKRPEERLQITSPNDEAPV